MAENTIRVEIGLTMNIEGEWVAYGDCGHLTQNDWRNSMRYKVVAYVPKPVPQEVSAVAHPIEHKQLLDKLAPWASAAIDDPNVCSELKELYQNVIDSI